MVTMPEVTEYMSYNDLVEARKYLQNRLDNEAGLPMYTRQLIFSDLQDVEIELEMRKY